MAHIRETIRLTMAQALVEWLCAQHIEQEDGTVEPLFAGLFGIFGHGNVTCLAEALERKQDQLPTWRGQNEQTMALAAVAYAKAKKRRRIMIASSSVGPGATNMVTAAGVAMANRLPVLILSGDTFNNRRNDPVLQQVEHPANPTMTVNDAFKPVVRYWDRITHGEQLMQSLPAALSAMLDPGDCGPAFLALPQDTQATAYDFPAVFFEKRMHRVPRPRADVAQLAAAADVLKSAKRPLIIAGGGVHYSLAAHAVQEFAEATGIPVVETVAGKTTLLDDHALYTGPIGTTGGTSANAMANEADVVLAIGTRLQDFTTGSWTVFAEDFRLIQVNAQRTDAIKHRAYPVEGDAKAAVEELMSLLSGYEAPQSWRDKATAEMSKWRAFRDERAVARNDLPVSYGQVVSAISDLSTDQDRVVAAAGGLPGELNTLWKAKSVGSFDLEYGFSCMGYEIAGGWGAAMAQQEEGRGETIVMVGDGSYMMANSDLYSTVLTGHKMIVIVCDNGGYAVINRLQVNKGGASFNNLYDHVRMKGGPFAVDFVKNAQSQGASAEKVATIDELRAAYGRAKASDHTYVIQIDVDAFDWTEGGCWWDVGVPEVSPREEVRTAREEHEAERAQMQRVGV